MKNLNSFSSITRAIEHEYQRQIKLLEAGGFVVQETRKWDQDKGKSISMRTKEDAHDYRYFPDPDLQPIVLSEDYIKSVMDSLPELPDVKKSKYIKTGLSEQAAEQISLDRETAEYYEKVLLSFDSPVLIANFMISEFLSKDMRQVTIDPKSFADLMRQVDLGIINNSIAKRVFTIMLESQLTAEAIIDQYDLALIQSHDQLKPIIKSVLEKNKRVVKDYLSGKDKAIQALVGQVMKATKGQADPEITLEILKKELSL
jgi:aspartyl-tRNA(Asn)/glutamyl-tRNA(Gln) amidotransferase subunit B